MNYLIPARFIERYAPLVNDEQAFLESLSTPLPKAFRVNSLKASVGEVRRRFENYSIPLTPLPWYNEAFIADSAELSSTLEYFLGSIYIQELSSMLPVPAIQDEISKVRLALDACAAPGSKTTQLAAMMKNRDQIVANDVSYSRIRALKSNLERCGVLNTVITNDDLLTFPEVHFDLILLDAPCSSEGTSRKNPAVLDSWSEGRIPWYRHQQQHLIIKAFDLLAAGGLLLYSTCTYAPEENELVVDHLLSRRPATLETIQIPNFRLSEGTCYWNCQSLNPELTRTARVWPHLNDTGGFFMARIRK